MGQSLATGMDESKDPKTAPRTDRPGTFDPLYGFPNGRKPREMKATREEKELADLEIELRDDCAKLAQSHKKLAELEIVLRDTCAQLAIPYERCMRERAPFASHYCDGLHHKWTDCLRFYKDHLIRMKEYERLERKLCKEKQQQAE